MPTDRLHPTEPAPAEGQHRKNKKTKKNKKRSRCPPGPQLCAAKRKLETGALSTLRTLTVLQPWCDAYGDATLLCPRGRGHGKDLLHGSPLCVPQTLLGIPCIIMPTTPGSAVEVDTEDWEVRGRK